MLAIGCFQRVDVEAGAAQPRLGLIDGNLVGLGIDPEQELALPDTLIVLDGDFDHLAGNSSIDGVLRSAHEGVVGRDKRLFGEIVGGAGHGQQDGERDQQRAA